MFILAGCSDLPGIKMATLLLRGSLTSTCVAIQRQTSTQEEREVSVCRYDDPQQKRPGETPVLGSLLYCDHFLGFCAICCKTFGFMAVAGQIPKPNLKLTPLEDWAPAVITLMQMSDNPYHHLT